MRIFNITYIKYLLLFASLLFVPATYAQDAELAVEDEELYADSVEVKTDSVRRDPSGRIYPYPNQSAFAKDFSEGCVCAGAGDQRNPGYGGIHSPG